MKCNFDTDTLDIYSLSLKTAIMIAEMRDRVKAEKPEYTDEFRKIFNQFFALHEEVFPEDYK
ncbi:MAG: hypothetical protein Q4B85_12590 [Lachnospiraceae bacterium]|nr:hypothetical protein [Lachnospiraceae bacterium]